MSAVHGPEIVVATAGSLTVARADETVTLPAGASVFVAASAGEYTLSGAGTAFRARVNDAATVLTSSERGHVAFDVALDALPVRR